MGALVIWYISWIQREWFCSVNGFGVEAANNFGLDDLLRPSQGRRCYRLNPDRLVIQIDTEKGRFAMFHCVSQGQSGLAMSNYIRVSKVRAIFQQIGNNFGNSINY